MICPAAFQGLKLLDTKVQEAILRFPQTRPVPWPCPAISMSPSARHTNTSSVPVNQITASLSGLVHVDEVLAWSDLSPRNALDKKGITRTVADSGSRTKARFTVVLAGAGDGRK